MTARTPSSLPTDEQRRVTSLVTRWYLALYHDTPQDPGVGRMFTAPAAVGAFAVSAAALAAGEPAALFRVLVATVMFQRRQDQQILRVLRGISAEDADELSSPRALLGLADACACERGTSLEALLRGCDLHKDAAGQGACAAASDVACALKRHAVLLKRYGHFGKVPTGLALVLREHGVADLAELRRWALSEAESPADASARLEGALRRAWRVSDKIAAMYLSMLANPDLCPGLAPWAEGLEHARWVVVDSNVDLFLASIGYSGTGTYAARAAFVRELASGVDLAEVKPSLQSYNPRVIQQAMYLFMSVTNRRVLSQDCSRVEGACVRCPEELATRCGLRGAPATV